MIDTYRKIRDLLGHGDRRQALFLFFMMIIMGLLNVVSVSLILPFMEILSKPELVEELTALLDKARAQDHSRPL